MPDRIYYRLSLPISIIALVIALYALVSGVQQQDQSPEITSQDIPSAPIALIADVDQHADAGLPMASHQQGDNTRSMTGVAKPVGEQPRSEGDSAHPPEPILDPDWATTTLSDPDSSPVNLGDFIDPDVHDYSGQGSAATPRSLGDYLDPEEHTESVGSSTQSRGESKTHGGLESPRVN